ncbi:MAG: pyridoxal-phosphate dependent enzyme [Pseudomonadota bacterium]
MLNSLPEIALQVIDDKLFKDKNIKLYMLRLDQSNDIISGNKWFKLKYNLIEAKKQNCKTLLSFGGAYSNHIHALAAAASCFNFESIGIIRGEQVTPLNDTLIDATNMGMHLHYINRLDYRKKTHPDFLKKLLDTFNPLYEKIYIVPEGGSNSLALKGAAEITDLIPIDYDYLCLGCGTGGTLAGIATALKKHPQAQLLGFPALKGADFLNAEIKQFHQNYNNKQYNNWSLNLDYHFGGFGKKNQQLLSFMDYFYQQHKIELDFLYTGKMMYGVYDLCKKNYFAANTSIITIHTGGIQGNRSLTTEK